MASRMGLSENPATKMKKMLDMLAKKISFSNGRSIVVLNCLAGTPIGLSVSQYFLNIQKSSDKNEKMLDIFKGGFRKS